VEGGDALKILQESNPHRATLKKRYKDQRGADSDGEQFATV
jgi:hypothetical protein